MITYEICKIYCLLAAIEYKIAHVFREDNKATDWLANWGIIEKKFVLTEERDFPKKLKGIVRINRSSLPNLRFIRI